MNPAQRDIEDLQIRLSHQELAIESLSDTVARQDRLIDELCQQFTKLRALLDEIRPTLITPGSDDGLPPHY